MPRTSDNPRHTGRSLANRPGADDEDKSRKEKSRSTETGFNSDPRAPNTQVPKNPKTYDSTTVQSPSGSQFIYTSSQQGPTPKPKSKPRPQVSRLLEGFLGPESGDYKACQIYCNKNPAIWIQDVGELRQLAITCLDEGDHEYARRCAERLLMINIAKQAKLTAINANIYLKSLSNNDDVFQRELQKLIDQLGGESTDTDVVASSSKDNPSQLPTTSSNSVQPPRPHPPVGYNTGLSSPVQDKRPPGQAFPQRKQQVSHEAGIPHRGPRLPSQAQLSYSSNAQAAAAFEAEEASEINTLSDNITLGERDRLGRVIDDHTEGVGPDLSLMSGSSKNSLHTSFKIYLGREAVEFFVKGQVFALVWHENAGRSANPNATETSAPLDKPFNRFTVNADGVTIFSHIRRFVIVKAKPTRRYCLAIPIHSYRGRGLTDKRMLIDEKQAHTIIYDSRSQPFRVSGEVELNKEPIAVDLVPGEELTPSSRLHFGKVQSIDWNVRVKEVGRVIPRHMRRLLVDFDREFRKGEETETETETEGKRRGKGAESQASSRN